MALSNRSQYLSEEAVRASGKVKGSFTSRFRRKTRGKLPEFYAGATRGDSVVGALDAPMMPTQHSGKLLVELFATYPIATEIVRHLRRTELMQLGLAASSMNSLLWTRTAADSVDWDNSRRQRGTTASDAVEMPTPLLSPHTYPIVTVAAAYLARLRVYRDELAEVDSDKTNGGTRVGYAYREDIRHPRYGPGSPLPVCNCQRDGCCRFGMCLGRGDAEDIWQPITWSRVDKIQASPLSTTRDELEHLISALERSPQWSNDQIHLMKGILAYRSLEIETGEKERLEWYWQLLSKHCKGCAVCGKSDVEISDPSTHLSFSIYKGTEKCWGCDAFFCTVGSSAGLICLLLSSC